MKSCGYLFTLFLLVALSLSVHAQLSYDYCSGSESYTTTEADVEFGCDGYASSTTSQWTFTSLTMKAAVEFLTINTESVYDTISIYDGDSTDDTLIGLFSGSLGTVNRVVYASGSSITVVFSSDSSVEEQGFSAVFMSTNGPSPSPSPIPPTPYGPCNGTEQFYLSSADESSSGEISFGCDGYGNDATYQWTFTSSSLYAAVEFKTFDTEPNYDKVYVYDGDNTDAPLIITLTGNLGEINQVFYGSGYSLTVVFTSDVSNTDPGFTAMFFEGVPSPTPTPSASPMPLARCSGSHQFHFTSADENSNGEINFGCDGYDNDVNYQWTFSSSSLYAAVEFFSLDTEANYDEVYVYDGDNTDAPLIATLSGNLGAINQVFYGSGHSLTIVFTSDVSNVDPGFSAIFFEGIPSPTPTPSASPMPLAHCNGTHQFNFNSADENSNGEINFGCDGYDNNAHYQWTFTSSSLYAAVEFISLDTEANYDLVDIYDGDNTSAPLITTLSGNLGQINQVFYGSGYSLTVVFTSDSSNVDPGFNAMFFEANPV